MIFKKAIPRRTFLTGVGVTLALPLLDSMVPAFGGTETAAKPTPRFLIVYTPNGITMDEWTPKAEGTAFVLPSILQPLTPYRDQMLILTALNHGEAEAIQDEGERAAPHERTGASFLTCVHPHPEGRVAISVDQVAAKELGKQTQLPSLELGMQNTDVVGSCEKGWSCAYLNTLSWSSAATPLPSENQPRAVFERLFGDNESTDPAVRLARIKQDRSILDSLTATVQRLFLEIPLSDRGKLGEFLDSIRDVERRIQLAEEQSSRELPVMGRPSSVPERFDDYAKIMFDLQILAHQCDLTRVSTFMMGSEESNRLFPEIGISEPHHGLSHHQNNSAKIAKITKINTYHAQNFAYLLDKMRHTADGDGSLLDHSIILYGSGLSDGNIHSHDNLPITLFGGGAGTLKGGRHLRYSPNTPVANLLVTILDKLNVPVDHFGNSTGELELLPLS